MRPREKRDGRPAATNGDPANIPTPVKTLLSLSECDDVAAQVDGSFVLVVKVSDGRYRRRCFLTALPAERAARKAQARGETATVYLCELKPVWKLTGGESA